MDRTFKGAAVRLDDIALPKLGAKIGVGEDEIHAFLDVETRGHGFDSQGRPVMLFEPHVFYRNLAGAARSHAVEQGLAYPKWGEKPYPADSYPRLKAACAIDEAAALKSASWGLGQVLGENFKAAGYPTPQTLVSAMMQSEELQLEAAISFIKANHLDAALRSHDWATFAKGYNGAAYKKNGYDTKLADAFRKWSRIKDTPWPPATPPAPVQTVQVNIPAPAPAAPETAPTVILPPAGADPVVIPSAPVPPAAQPTIPRKKTGIAAILAIVISIIAGFLKAHFGG
ncbi:N-acetylmuramidase family protein [Mesorhizobium sp. B2-3-2]|uniref:N-acetylmuramidase family protein n=1 Tax=Mesorhizobium sp. B2-3-2 TaxID=2589961 RepID=UPI0011271C96|nr:N-acetylmuramidase family protein [Mesorhizobium sp. B2-3-2]TPM37059.1 N-acetylmuramidase family protein [Mesorhizobium sp. B2-3-2]